MHLSTNRDDFTKVLNDGITIVCPYCDESYDGDIDLACQNVRCDTCGGKFYVSSQVWRGKMSQVPTDILIKKVEQLLVTIRNDASQKDLLSHYSILDMIDRVSDSRLVAAQEHAISLVRAKVPFLLRVFSGVFVKCRSVSMEEVRLESIKAKIKMAKMIIQRRVPIIDMESTFAFRAKEVVEDFIRNLKGRGSPRIITKEFFNCQANERIYYYSKDVMCTVPHKSSDERYWGGTLVITNQRVVYSSPQHKQSYKINLIRDFQVVDSRTAISIATSERRREVYSLQEVWIVYVIIMFIWNDQFRERILTSDIGSSVNYIVDGLRLISLGNFT